jgi:hypothetical protein
MKHRMQTKGGVQVSQGGLERREGLGMGEREELEEEEGAATKKQSQKIVYVPAPGEIFRDDWQGSPLHHCLLPSLKTQHQTTSHIIISQCFLTLCIFNLEHHRSCCWALGYRTSPFCLFDMIDCH